MAGSAAFWNKIADKYSRQPVADEAIYQQKLAKTRDYLRADMELLEIGCGTGSTAITHAPKVKHIDAADISENMLAIARQKAETAGISNVTFQQADIEEMEAGGKQYDMVLALSFLHLVTDRDAVLQKIFHMLKPGGYLVSSTACIGDSFPILGFIAPLGRKIGLLPVLKAFTEKQLVDSITSAGFAIEHQWQPGPKKAVFIIAHKPE